MTIRRLELPGRSAESAPAARAGPAAVNGPIWPRLSELAEVYARAGHRRARLRDARTDSQSVIMALSGGIDSALTATIAADAIGA